MTPVDDGTIALAHRLADAAGAVIRPYFRARIAVTDKGAAKGDLFDPVTEADRKAEEAIRAILDRERPDDAVLGEEHGRKEGSSGFCWTLDPIDGTRAFITGRHEWGTLIALERDGRPILGILDQPVLGERYLGANGTTTLRQNGLETPLRARPCAGLSEAVLAATHPYAYFETGEREAFRNVARAVKMSRFGGDCYLFAMLAMGFIDLVVESHFNRWDVAALIPIVEGAGGIVTDWAGRPCHDGGQVLAAGDVRVHEAALALLMGAAG